MTAHKKDSINVIVSIATLVLGWALTITAFFLNPMGEVHDSVLWVLGQSLTFAGSLLGAKSYIDYMTSNNSKPKEL